MQLSTDDLQRRHDYWKYEIGRAGIWNPLSFLPVSIHIRKHHRRYNAVFQRRIVRNTGAPACTDKIIIYRNSDDFEERFVDSVLVHEMIHQYIFQNNIKDSSSHGRVFKDYMQRINAAFEGRLRIRLKDSNPAIPTHGAGQVWHRLLVVETDSHFFCCVIHPSKTAHFERMASREKRAGRFRRYSWYESDDVHFSRFSRCMKVLHGEKVSLGRLEDYKTKYRLKPLA